MKPFNAAAPTPVERRLDPSKAGDMKFEFQKAASLMDSIAKPEDALILVGNTKVGKSTLINRLMGNRLIAAMNNRRRYYYAKADEAIGPEIGTEAVSKTSEPRRFESFLHNLVLYDLPGFCDNRSEMQDVINGVSVCELLKRLKSAKMILIISWDDLINDDTTLLLRSFTGVENLLGRGMKDCFASIGVVISKVDERDSVDRKCVCKILQSQLLSSEEGVTLKGMTPTIKSFVKYLTAHDRQIGIFERPSSGDREIAGSADDVVSGIMSTVRKVRPIKSAILRQVSPNVSEEAKAFLYGMREQLIAPEAFTELQALVAKFLRRNYSLNQEMKARTTGELRKMIADLSVLRFKIEQYLTNCPTVGDQINALKTFDPSIKEFVVDADLCQKIVYNEIINKLLKSQESDLLDIYLKTIFTNAVRDIDRIFIDINVRAERIEQEQADNRARLLKGEYEYRCRKLEEQIEMLKSKSEKSYVPIVTYMQMGALWCFRFCKQLF